MAYIRSIIRGRTGTNEIWSIGLNWGIFGLANDLPDQTYVDDTVLNFQEGFLAASVPLSLRTLLSTSGTITGIRVEKRDEADRILSVAEGDLPAPIAGSGGASKSPQDALVLSLRTSTPGARGRGRVYWPALGATLSGTTFNVTTPTTENTVADAVTFFRTVGDLLNKHWVDTASAQRVVLSVRSQRDRVNRDVTSVQVGNVVDTQRRRRDSIVETYRSLAYP